MAAGCETVIKPRRYYLLMQRYAAAQDQAGLVDAFHAKQLAEPGTDLPGDFPEIELLNGAGYLAVEDLNGATVQELERFGLTTKQAQTVLAALAPLL